MLQELGVVCFITKGVKMDGVSFLVMAVIGLGRQRVSILFPVGIQGVVRRQGAISIRMGRSNRLLTNFFEPLRKEVILFTGTIERKTVTY